MRLGVFGGSFDPIHLGHLIIAQEVIDREIVDKVLFIPAGNPWMKSRQAISSAEHRIAMVSLAIQSNPGFLVSDLEIRRTGASHTTETLQQLALVYGPSTKLFLVLGTDTVADLERWHMPHRLFDLSTAVFVNRACVKGVNSASLEPFGDAATEKSIWLDTPSIGISSTGIRERVATGIAIRYLVPGAVQEYISEHGLYVRC